MARRVSRKIELFTIHAHNKSEIDYEDIFSTLDSIEKKSRIASVRGMIIGFPFIIKIDDMFFIQALEGDPDSAPLIFDSSTGDTVDNDLEENEVLSLATHFIVAPRQRLAAIEYVRRGAKALQLGPAITEILKNGGVNYRNLQLEFAPKLESSFAEQISSFERIRVASVRVLRPNASWTDHYTELSELMEQSGGEKAEIDIRAGRGGSLEKDKGIVEVIKEIANDAYPYIEDASITGTRENETAETVVRSNTHTVHARVNVEVDRTGMAHDNSIRAKLLEFISAWIL